MYLQQYLSIFFYKNGFFNSAVSMKKNIVTAELNYDLKIIF